MHPAVLSISHLFERSDIERFDWEGSAAPGPGGVPIEQSIEVREAMGSIEH